MGKQEMSVKFWTGNIIRDKEVSY